MYNSPGKTLKTLSELINISHKSVSHDGLLIFVSFDSLHDTYQLSITITIVNSMTTIDIFQIDFHNFAIMESPTA